MARYKIKDMGKGFDGLVVEGELIGRVKDSWGENYGDVVAVEKIVNDNAVFGDRNVSYPVVPHSLFISSDHLDEITTEAREFDSKNPFGKVLYEGRYSHEEMEVTFTQFEKGLSISVAEFGPVRKTLYSQNFFGDLVTVKETIERYMAAGVTDVAELIFSLRELKDLERR